MKKTVNWGIIAPGKIARKFASDMKLVEGANLYAVASRDISRAKEFANEFGAEKYYANYHELVKDPGVDVVYIASPHPFHFEQSLLCLNNGKHVLCEKPICMNAQEVAQLVDVAQSKKLFLMEALWTRFIPSFMKCKEMVEKGEIGEVLGIHADFGFKAEYNTQFRTFNKELGGGSLLDIGIYPVFLALEIAGKPDKIEATGVFGETGVDESCIITFMYSDPKIVALLSSTFLLDTPTEAIISGTRGSIKLHGKWHAPTKLSLIKNGKEELFTFDEPGFGYQYEIQEVMECLSGGELQSKGFPLEKSLLLHRTLDEIRRIIGLSY